MPALTIATMFLVLSHVLPSAPAVRARLVTLLGHRAFYSVYSLVSLIALAAVILAYREAEPAPWLTAAFYPLNRWLAVGLMPIAVLLVLGRLSTRPQEQPRGIYRLTAVPGSLGLLLWCILHLANVSDMRAAVIFLGMAAIALAAIAKNLPLAPAARRRVGLIAPPAHMLDRAAWSEIGWWRVVLAGLAYLALLALHPLVIGPDPLAALI